VPRMSPLRASQVYRWRAMALEESRALRALYRAHGRIPRTRPLRFDVLDGPALKLWRRGHEGGNDR